MHNVLRRLGIWGGGFGVGSFTAAKYICWKRCHCHDMKFKVLLVEQHQIGLNWVMPVEKINAKHSLNAMHQACELNSQYKETYSPNLSVTQLRWCTVATLSVHNTHVSIFLTHTFLLVAHKSHKYFFGDIFKIWIIFSTHVYYSVCLPLFTLIIFFCMIDFGNNQVFCYPENWRWIKVQCLFCWTNKITSSHCQSSTLLRVFDLCFLN